MNTATNTKIQTAIQQEYVQTGTAPTRTNPPVVEPVRESCNIRDYVLGLEYLNEEPEGYYHEEGRINLLAGGRVEYTLKDHLGNGRVYCYHNAALNQAKTIQATHYYAFGLPIQKLSPNFEAAVGVEANNYQYNGIELVEDFGLQVNHAQFRTLNPQTGAWWQIDPMAEKFYAWSPYNSNLGNPVRYDDPKGDTPGPGGADKQPTNRNDIDAGGGGGGAALAWSFMKLVTKAFGIGYGADAAVQVGDNMVNEGMSFPDAVSKVELTSCAISGSYTAYGTAAFSIGGISSVSSIERVVYATSATAGFAFWESVSKQAFDGKSEPLNGTQVAIDVITDVTIGGLTNLIEPKISSNGGNITLETASEVTSNTAQNKLNSIATQNSKPTHNSKPTQKNSTPTPARHQHASWEMQ